MTDWFRDLLCRCGPEPDLCIGDDEVLTHYGTFDQRHKRTPEPPPKAPGLSVLRGRLAPRDTFLLVSRRPPTSARIANTLVRYTTAGRLRAAGFVVLHTPTWNAKHCSVVLVEHPRSGTARSVSPWPELVSTRFDACFAEYVPREEGRA